MQDRNCGTNGECVKNVVTSSFKKIAGFWKVCKKIHTIAMNMCKYQVPKSEKEDAFFAEKFKSLIPRYTLSNVPNLLTIEIY